MITASDEGIAQVWDAHTGEPLTPGLRHGLGVLDAAFGTLGGRAITASADRTARIWLMLPDTRSVEDLTLMAQLLAGARIDPAGDFLLLDPQEIGAAWKKLRTKYPEDFRLPKMD